MMIFMCLFSRLKRYSVAGEQASSRESERMRWSFEKTMAENLCPTGTAGPAGILLPLIISKAFISILLAVCSAVGLGEIEGIVGFIV